MNQKVLKETVSAYCDSNPKVPFEQTMKLRNLQFHASEPVSRAEAVGIMTKALFLKNPAVEGYNNFAPALLNNLPLNADIWLAREYSVCVYVDMKMLLDSNDLKQLQTRMNADECDRDANGKIRIWWD